MGAAIDAAASPWTEPTAFNPNLVPGEPAMHPSSAEQRLIETLVIELFDEMGVQTSRLVPSALPLTRLAKRLRQWRSHVLRKKISDERQR